MVRFSCAAICPVNHHLVGSRIFRNTCAIITTLFGAAPGGCTANFFLGHWIARPNFRSPLSSPGFSSSLRAPANSCALRASRSPSGVLEPRRVRPGLLPCVKLWVLSASLSRLRDNSSCSQFLSTLVSVALCPSVRPCQIRSSSSFSTCLSRARISFSFASSVSLSWFNCSLACFQANFLVFDVVFTVTSPLSSFLDGRGHLS